MISKYTSFSKRLTRRIVLALMLTLGVLFAVIYMMTVAITFSMNKSTFHGIMDVESEFVEKVLYGVELSVNSNIAGLGHVMATPEGVYAVLESELISHPQIMGFFVAFEPGYYPGQGRWFEPYVVRQGDAIVRMQAGSEQHDYLAREWYQKAFESENGYWSAPYPDDMGTGMPLCTFAVPLRDAEGRKVGVFGADISLRWLHEQMQKMDDKTNTSRTASETLAYLVGGNGGGRERVYSFIIGGDGTYVVHPDRARILNEKFTAFDISKEDEGTQECDLDDRKVYVFYEKLHHTDWKIGMVATKYSIMLPVYAFAVAMALAMALGLLAVAIICRTTIRRSTSPLNALAESADEVAKGNFSTQLPLLSCNDEISQLRDSFDNMQQSLSHYIEELKVTTAAKTAMESELEIARSIQMSMVPKTFPAFPERDDIDVYAAMKPAREVGGDLYDYLLCGNRLYFCIGDVAGKGIPAALIMAQAQSLFRTFANENQSPERIMKRINASLCYGNDSSWFVTMIIGVLDLQTGRLDFCNAGHVSPVVIGSEVSILDMPPSLPVGILAETSYTLQQVTLPPKAMLLFYTDGLIEAKDREGHLFGENRMIELASRWCGRWQLSPQAVITAMSEAVSAFVGGAEQHDDLTMLAVLLRHHTV